MTTLETILGASVEPSASISSVAKIMMTKNSGSVFVIERKRPIGVIREVDIVRKVIAKGLDPKKVKAKEIMLSPPPKVRSGAGLKEVANVIAKTGVKHVLMSKNGEYVGTITAGDFMNVLSCLRMGTVKFCRALSSAPRTKILELLSVKPMTVDELAKKLKLKPITVRHHLELLMRVAMVEDFEEERGRPGRPSLRFRLTSAVIKKT